MKTQVQKHPKSKEPYKALNWTVTGVFVLFIIFMTFGQNHEFLWKLQDLDLFIYDGSYFVDSVHRVGGLSMYLGSFLYQFFYYPLVGSLLLLVLLTLVGLLTAKTFNLKGWSFPLAFIPALALLLALTELGYMIYYMKIDGYVFSNILGLLLTLAGLLFFQKFRKTPSKVVFGMAYLVIAFPISGSYALFGAFLMVLASLRSLPNKKNWKSYVLPMVILVFIILVPLFYYRFIFYQTALATIYTENLPYFMFNGAEIKLWLPYLIMVIFLIWAVLWKQETGSKKPNLLLKVLPTALFISCLTVVYLFSYKDANFNTELSMQNAADREDWNEVLKLARNQKDEPTRLIVMTTNLALYKLGIASDKMFYYTNGDKAINSPRIIAPVHFAGKMLYYQYGLINYCNKWCMEGMVEYGMNVSTLKYSVLSALLNGEIALSKKYNGLLKSTLFYRSWALKYQQYLDHPNSISEVQEFKNILSLTNYDDDLDGDFGNIESFLRNHFSFMREVSPELTELSVLFNLDMKNIERFWPRLFRWVHLNPTKKIPVHFQEAALLYEHLEHKVDLTGAPFDENVKANFKIFVDLVQQYVKYPESTIKNVLHNQFPNTFWYYYFFVTDQESQKDKDKKYQN